MADDGDSEFEPIEDEGSDDGDDDEDSFGDDLPGWWDEDMPDDWMDYDLDGYEYEEFEIGIDYGEDT